MGNLLTIYRMLSAEYFIYILVAVALVVALTWFLRKLEGRHKKIAEVSFLVVIGVLLLGDFVYRIIGFANYNFMHNLPIDIVYASYIFILFSYFNKKVEWKKVILLTVLPVNAFMIIFPPQQYLTISSFSLGVICFNLSATFIIAYSLLSFIWSEEDLEQKDVFIAFTDYVIAVAIVHLLNVILRFTGWGRHANYFGTMGEEYNTIIQWLNSLIPIPFLVILPLFVLLVGIEFVIYLPFRLTRRSKEKRAKIEELVALGNFKAQQEYLKDNKNQSKILVRSEIKARPEKEKKVVNNEKSGFVTTNKTVQINNDFEEKK